MADLQENPLAQSPNVTLKLHMCGLQAKENNRKPKLVYCTIHIIHSLYIWF